MDAKTQADVFGILIDKGVLNPNECREPSSGTRGGWRRIRATEHAAGSPHAGTGQPRHPEIEPQDDEPQDDGPEGRALALVHALARNRPSRSCWARSGEASQRSARSMQGTRRRGARRCGLLRQRSRRARGCSHGLLAADREGWCEARRKHVLTQGPAGLNRWTALARSPSWPSPEVPQCIGVRSRTRCSRSSPSASGAGWRRSALTRGILRAAGAAAVDRGCVKLAPARKAVGRYRRDQRRRVHQPGSRACSRCLSGYEYRDPGRRRCRLRCRELLDRGRCRPERGRPRRCGVRVPEAAAAIRKARGEAHGAVANPVAASAAYHLGFASGRDRGHAILHHGQYRRDRDARGRAKGSGEEGLTVTEIAHMAGGRRRNRRRSLPGRRGPAASSR